jgi:hypothetical protein
MKKRKKKPKTPVRTANIDVGKMVYGREVVQDRIRTHILGLQFEYMEDYFEWCKKYGFKETTRSKSWNHFGKEKEQRMRESADAKMAQSKQEHKPKQWIKNQLTKGGNRYLDDKIRASARPLFEHILEVSDMLRESEIKYALIKVANYASDWIRPVKEWKPKSHNRRRQFSSLLRHLFCKYDVPLFMDSAWFNDDLRFHFWFLHLGQGDNIRTAIDLPVPLTKKMAHQFLQAPKNYLPLEAIRWGQIRSLGGIPRLVEQANAADLGFDKRQDDFWLSVYRFFVQNPMLDLEHFRAICDYIKNQKYGGERVFVAPGVVENAPPPQPNFSMKGRDPETLLRRVGEWHKRLGKAQAGKNLQWERSGFPEYEHQDRNKKQLRIWTVTEILNQRDLIQEGRDMRHCVASYAGSCTKGYHSIWSIELDSYEGKKKLGTIQVVNQSKTISQVAAKCNARLDAPASNVLQRWAKKAGLQLSRWSRF